MAELVSSIGWALLVAVLWQTVMFGIAKQLKRVDVVDVGWGLTFIVIAVVTATMNFPLNTAAAVVMILVVLWGARLSLSIGRRLIRSASQDPRYTELTKNYKPTTYWANVYLRIFIVQAVLAVMISLPVVIVMTQQPMWSGWLSAGVIVWIIGFVCEVVADAQLRDFLKSAKKDELMNTGLWRYSRHPNYFGEMLMWWGLAIMSGATAYGWLGVVGALVITVLLRFVSGVPPAEARAASKRGWKQYKDSTSVLVPWFKKLVTDNR